MLSDLESTSIEDISARLTRLISPSNIGIVISKLKSKVNAISPNGAMNLVCALGRSGPLFPFTDTALFGTDPSTQAAFLISKLLKQIEPPNRYGVAEAVSLEAEPLSFACRVVRRICSPKDTPPENRRLTREEDAELWLSLAGRIRDSVLSNGARSFEEPRNAANYLSIWSANRGDTEVREFLTKDFEDHPEDAILLMSGFLGTAYYASGSQPGDFDHSTYELVCRIIAPSILHDCVVRLFGDAVLNPVYDGSTDRPLKDTIAHQFEHIHNLVLAAAAQKPPVALT